MTSSLDTSPIKVKPVFARHETFHPRFGWLKKGFDAAQENPQVFLKEDAPVTLGVGKNMVKSIRYWCNTFKVLSEDRTAPLGKKLLADGGWDSFLENPASPLLDAAGRHSKNEPHVDTPQSTDAPPSSPPASLPPPPSA
jgi:hypothetical protein